MKHPKITLKKKSQKKKTQTTAIGKKSNQNQNIFTYALSGDAQNAIQTQNL